MYGISRIINKFKSKSEFTKNVLTLMTGTTIAQAIPIAISPILTRIYTPEDFGVFALYIAIVSFIAIIVTARYELAIVLPKDDADAINVLFLSLVIMFIIVFFTTSFILLFKDDILVLLNAKDIGNFIYLIPVSVFIAGLNQSFNYWSNRKEYFNTMSSSKISQSIGMSITQPNFGYFNIFGGLIIGDLFGKIISGFVLINKFIKNDKEQIKNINKLVVLEQMKKYKDFPLVNSLHAFSDVIRTSGSIMLISSFFGSTILGFYALSLRVLQAPVGIIGSALGQVLYKKFTFMYNYNEDLSPYVKKIVLILFFIAVPSFGTLYYIAPDLFAFVFGEKWRIAGEYSQYLTPYLFINFIVSPISSLPIILNKQKEFFYFSLAGNIGMPLLLFISYKLNYDLKEALILITIYMSSLHIFILSWIFSIIKKKKHI